MGAGAGLVSVSAAADNRMKSRMRIASGFRARIPRGSQRGPEEPFLLMVPETNGRKIAGWLLIVFIDRKREDPISELYFGSWLRGRSVSHLLYLCSVCQRR